MSRLIMTDEDLARMNEQPGPSEIYDSAGKLLGYFMPVSVFADYQDAWEIKHKDELDELDRIANDPDVGTLQELWDELGVK